MKIDYEALSRDMLIKKNRLKKSEREIADLKIISRATWHRIQKGKPLMLETYLKLCEWLEKPLEQYVLRNKRPSYIQKRLDEIKNPEYDKYNLHDWVRK